MAMPNPIPVLIVSSRCLSDARMLSRSSGLILPRATSRSMSSTMALQRSVAFISGMICSAESRLAKDMQYFPCGGRKLNVGVSDDKFDLVASRRGQIPAPDLDPHPNPANQRGPQKRTEEYDQDHEHEIIGDWFESLVGGNRRSCRARHVGH